MIRVAACVRCGIHPVLALTTTEEVPLTMMVHGAAIGLMRTGVGVITPLTSAYFACATIK